MIPRTIVKGSQEASLTFYSLLYVPPSFGLVDSSWFIPLVLAQAQIFGTNLLWAKCAVHAPILRSSR